MKYYKRLKVFKSKRAWFDPQLMRAYSYDWWRFVDYKKGYGVIFNAANYSMQTRYHQNGVESALEKLGIKYKTVYIRTGLQNITGEISNKLFEIKQYKEAIKKPRSWKKTNARRVSWIKHLEKDIISLKKLDKAKNIEYKKPIDFTVIFKEEKEKRDAWLLKNADMLKKKAYHKDFEKLINSKDRQ